MAKTKVNLIEQFVINNKLNFTRSGSDLNGNCVILAGYACYLGLDWNEFTNLVIEFDPNDEVFPCYIWNDMEKVFEYAYNHDYGKWWNSPDAKKMYTF